MFKQVNGNDISAMLFHRRHRQSDVTGQIAKHLIVLKDEPTDWRARKMTPSDTPSCVLKRLPVEFRLAHRNS